jgi:hypothetical protein
VNLSPNMVVAAEYKIGKKERETEREATKTFIN